MGWEMIVCGKGLVERCSLFAGLNGAIRRELEWGWGLVWRG
jgi:hypothetical protein